MINLENTKIVLFDFDDTLCIHSQHYKTDGREYNKSIVLGEDYWNSNGCEPNSQMKRFMEHCKSLGLSLGLISATPSYKHMTAKNEWVLQNYGIELENYCTGSFEDKIRIMVAISDAMDLKREQILFVDDYFKNLEAAGAEHFQVCTPMEVVNFVNKYI